MQQVEQTQQAAEKKEYTAPKLITLGEIEQLTQFFPIGGSEPIRFN